MCSPENLKFTKEHEWIRQEGQLGVVGITEDLVGVLSEIRRDRFEGKTDGPAERIGPGGAPGKICVKPRKQAVRTVGADLPNNLPVARIIQVLLVGIVPPSPLDSIVWRAEMFAIVFDLDVEVLRIGHAELGQILERGAPGARMQPDVVLPGIPDAFEESAFEKAFAFS